MDKSELYQLFSSQPNKFYNAPVLKSFGFKRRKCPKCSDWFWSIDKQTCGDTNCEGGYGFIGKHDLGWDFLTTVQKYERFFEKNGHRVVEPYPVVARWRKDLFFVIASIADFQPWVLNGTVDPPANPLVISQPCMRFVDIDNVGRTGRHFTQFFMGGQHAFNLPDYWIDKTIGLGFKFLVEELKIPQTEITYKEDVWSGGGNFGPSMEAFAHGLELVNHVFMQFEETATGYREMDRRVVDTGWGLDRLTHYATGASNNYEAVFPNIARLRIDQKIELDFDASRSSWEQLGLLNIDEPTKVPASAKQFLKQNKRLFALYTILDHTRATAFALADGALPSNIGGGYNIRNLLRRAWTLADKHKLELDMADLIKVHSKYLSKRFKNLRDMPDIQEIIGLEKKRFIESKKRGKEMVAKYLQKGQLQPKLMELYESHGVNPEMAVEIARAAGQEIKVPEDFYLRLAKKEKRVFEPDEHTDLPETKQLYHELPPDRQFDAKVVWQIGTEVILDKSLFYPTSGGQESDTGLLEWNNGKARVIEAKRQGKSIILVLDGAVPTIGTAVKGKLDLERRLDLTRHHTAVHIVNGAAHKVLGNHVWQAGADKTQEKARLDITHYKSIAGPELREIEREANKIVLQNLPVKKMMLNRTEAEQRFGFSIYQGGAVPGAKLRIIQIPGKDAEACGGTHTDRTGSVGMIKLIGSKRIQDGVVRIELLAGLRSLERMWETEDQLAELAAELKSPIADLKKAVAKLKGKPVKKTLVKLKLRGKGIKWAIVDAPFREMEKIAKKQLGPDDKAIVMINKQGGVIVVSKGKINSLKIAKKMAKKMGGSAGGDAKLARGGGGAFSETEMKKLLEGLA
ncbi:MAG: alanine--tRNA ligase [Candidatus Altiarchaeota archaeon]|nr:alanine--tRNA ligase [Candidatus Altiarchaeota archaeon]